MYPCSIHGKRIVGRLGAAYPAIVYRGSRRSAKLRLCDPCLDSLFATLGTQWIRATGDDDGNFLPLCGTCSQSLESLDDPHAFFLTVYRRGQEREDWFGAYCAGCAAGLIDTLKLTA
jgi:hypothetical protein